MVDFNDRMERLKLWLKPTYEKIILGLLFFLLWENKFNRANPMGGPPFLQTVYINKTTYIDITAYINVLISSIKSIIVWFIWHYSVYFEDYVFLSILIIMVFLSYLVSCMFFSLKRKYFNNIIEDLKLFLRPYEKIIMTLFVFSFFVPFINFDNGIRCFKAPCPSNSFGTVIQWLFHSYHSHIFYISSYILVVGLVLSYLISHKIISLRNTFREKNIK